MKKTLLVLLLFSGMANAVDFTFALDGSYSTIGKSKVGISMGVGDFTSRYKSGFVHGWNIGITTVGSGDPDQTITDDGVIITTPSDIKDTMLIAEYRPTIRWHERNELYGIIGGTWNHVTKHSYGYGGVVGVGYQRHFDSTVFVGGSFKYNELKFNSGDEKTEEYDGKQYQVYVASVYMGFRF